MKKKKNRIRWNREIFQKSSTRLKRNLMINNFFKNSKIHSKIRNFDRVIPLNYSRAPRENRMDVGDAREILIRARWDRRNID